MPSHLQATPEAGNCHRRTQNIHIELTPRMHTFKGACCASGPCEAMYQAMASRMVSQWDVFSDSSTIAAGNAVLEARDCQNATCSAACGTLSEGKLPLLSASAAQRALPNSGSSFSSTKGLFCPSSFTRASPWLSLLHCCAEAASKLAVNGFLNK